MIDAHFGSRYESKILVHRRKQLFVHRWRRLVTHKYKLSLIDQKWKVFQHLKTILYFFMLSIKLKSLLTLYHCKYSSHCYTMNCNNPGFGDGAQN